LKIENIDIFKEKLFNLVYLESTRRQSLTKPLILYRKRFEYHKRPSIHFTY